MRTILAILCCTFAVAAAAAATVKPKPVHAAQAVGKAPPTKLTLPIPLPSLPKLPSLIPQTPAATPTTTTSTSPADLLASLENIVLTDVQDALNDANAQVPPDTLAAACWQAIINAKTSIPVLSPPPAGAALVYGIQKVRDLQNLVAQFQSNSGPLVPLQAACAPVVVSVENMLVAITTGVGLKAIIP
jgi:hypothetical protein